MFMVSCMEKLLKWWKEENEKSRTFVFIKSYLYPQDLGSFCVLLKVSLQHNLADSLACAGLKIQLGLEQQLLRSKSHLLSDHTSVVVGLGGDRSWRLGQRIRTILPNWCFDVVDENHRPAACIAHTYERASHLGASARDTSKKLHLMIPRASSEGKRRISLM